MLKKYYGTPVCVLFSVISKSNKIIIIIIIIKNQNKLNL